MFFHFNEPAKLRTKTVVFEATYYARDSGTLEQLKDLTTKRKAITDSINGSSNLTAAIAREMAGGVTSPILQDLQKLEKYIPLLENLVLRVLQQLSMQLVRWTSELEIRWTSALSGTNLLNLSGLTNLNLSGLTNLNLSGLATGISNLKYTRIDDLRFELAMMLSLYAALLRARALELIPADLVESARLFRKASGVYQYLGQVLLPGMQPVLPSKVAELTPSMAKVMSLVSLGEAQAVTILKAEQSSTSTMLLAKLHYGVVMFLEEAVNILHSNTGDWTDFPEKVNRFVTSLSVLHEARCRRYIADEFKKSERLGTAVALLRLVSRKAQLVKPPSDAASKTVFKEEIQALNEMLRKCEYENDFVWREKSPRPEELPLMEGRKIVTPLEYIPSGLGRELIFVTDSAVL